MQENAVKAEASTTVLMPYVVAVQACLASGVKADPSLAAKKSSNTTKAFYIIHQVSVQVFCFGVN